MNNIPLSEKKLEETNRKLEDFLNSNNAGKQIKEFMDNIDFERANKANERLGRIGLTVETLAWFENEARFAGDWDRHIAWVRENGSEEQKEEDIPMLEELKEKEKRGELGW